MGLSTLIDRFFGRTAETSKNTAKDRLRLLSDAHLQLRPYRLLDRLGVVTTAHGWARRIKHKLVS